MLKGQNEIRMMWLMVLIIVAIGLWFADLKEVSALCILAFGVSVMHYVDDLQQPADQLSQQLGLRWKSTSRAPLYTASVIALVGGVAGFHLLTGLGLSAWIFFFLRWLKRLERQLLQTQYYIQQQQKASVTQPLELQPSSSTIVQEQAMPRAENIEPIATEKGLNLIDQLQLWLFKGNPVLKVAIGVLVIGIVLLLRFATEHWQLSLTVKLLLVAGVSAAITALGYRLVYKNRSFALALEGLGLASLSFTLFFAYYNQVIPSLAVASCCFALILVTAVWLSLKQQSIELALMAMIMAYIAPFTLPVRSASAVEFVSYYLVINIAVAVLSTLRPWKFLNQIAFLMTLFVGGSYAIYHGVDTERPSLSILIFAHASIFIWLGFRFSQLLAKENLSQFELKPILDLVLIFGTPIVSYIFLYLMYFDDNGWQATFSLAFAAIYALLYTLAKRYRVIEQITQSYFSLMLIFLAFVPPILLTEHWSVAGWALEGAFIFIYALYRQSRISHYVGMGLLLMAGCSAVYYFSVENVFPSPVYWILAFSYLSTVCIANAVPKFQQQLNGGAISFFCLQMLFTTILLFVLLLDVIDSKNQVTCILLILSLGYVLVNELLLRRGAIWSWLLPKWIGLIPLYAVAYYMVIDVSHQGALLWPFASDRVLVAVTGLLLTLLWLRPLLGLKAEKEWVSLGVLLSLALSSLTLVPSMPFISVVILPLCFALWCAWRQSDWPMFWQARSSLVLMSLWVILSQIFSQQAFQFYLMPVLNPFDLVSIAMLAGFIWMLNQQMKAGLDNSLGAMMMVLGLLWLSSYVVLRALHHYLATPYNQWQMWQDATIQLSFTLLWVSLAFICMLLASRRQLRSLWFFGGSILVLVTLKLVLFDLSHIGTLTRVISFLGAGFVMLIISYIAPMPEISNQPRPSKHS